jgi:hypothetical protein
VTSLQDLVMAVVSGGALIILGLTPRLWQRLMEGIYNFHQSLSSSFPIPPQRPVETGKRSWWLVCMGTAVIALELAGYARS